MNRQELPITGMRQRIIEIVQANQVTLVVGATGCGKTTQVSQFLLDAGFAEHGYIACTEPRRVAVVSVASRVAEERASQLGEEIGYQIRFEKQVSARTKVKFVTSGVLLRETMSDPVLSQYACVVVDEAHERDIFNDFLLAYLKKVIEQRPNFRLVIMSATLNWREFLSFFPNAKLLYIPLEYHPVTTEYHPVGKNSLGEGIESEVMRIHKSGKEGDVLIFLPGEKEIREVVDRFEVLRLKGLVCLPLYGGLSLEKQKAIFKRTRERKVIVATNIAESSLTIEGVVYVIDSGFEKLAGYDSHYGVETLELARISKSSAEQRKGRAGRTQPGVCIRLYSEDEFNARPRETTPEILRSDLSGLVLSMKSIGLDASFQFLDRPSSYLWASAEKKLQGYGVLDDTGNLTPYGEQIARMPIDAQAAHFILTSVRWGCLEAAITIAAMLAGGRFSFVKELYENVELEVAKERFADPDSDFLTLLNIWDAYEAAEYSDAWCKENYLEARRMRSIRRIREDLLNYFQRQNVEASVSVKRDPEIIGKAILDSFRDNLLRYHRRGVYATRGGLTEVVLAQDSVLAERQPDYVVCYSFRRTSRVFANCNHLVRPEWLRDVFRSPATQPVLIELPKPIHIDGTLRVSTNTANRLVHVDIDLQRSAGREVVVVDRGSVVVEETKFPVSLLGMTENVCSVLRDVGIVTLSQLPNNRIELEAKGLDESVVNSVLSSLGRFGYVAKNLPPPEKQIQEGLLEEESTSAQPAFANSVLEQSIADIGLSGTALMLLWSVGIEKVKQLAAKTEGELREIIKKFLADSTSRKNPNRRVAVEGPLREIEDKLASLGLALAFDLEATGILVTVGKKLMNLRTANSIDDETAAQVLGDQFPLFHQFRTSTSRKERIELRNQITTKNLGLARKMAQMYLRLMLALRDPMLDWDDLFQDGSLGLMRSVETFDYSRGVKFSSYAMQWIRSAVRRTLDERSALPVHAAEKVSKMHKAYHQLTEELSEEPTREQVAKKLGWEVETVDHVLSTAQFWYHFPSLESILAEENDQSSKGDKYSEDTITLQIDTYQPSVYELLAHKELKRFVQQTVATNLHDETDQLCVELYFGLNGNRIHTLEEIGDYLSLTRERIRQRIERALSDLRKPEVWEKAHRYLPSLRMPSLKALRFTTEVTESVNRLTHSRRTREDVARDILKSIAGEYSVDMEEITKGGSLPQPLEHVRARAIGELHRVAHMPSEETARLLNLSDKWEAEEIGTIYNEEQAKKAVSSSRDSPDEEWRWHAIAIILQVAKEYGYTTESLMLGQRSEILEQARDVVIYRLREELKLPFMHIATTFSVPIASVIHAYFNLVRMLASGSPLPKGIRQVNKAHV